jgi:hypothetical protein
MNLMAAKAYGKRPRIGQGLMPLFNPTLDAPRAKRRRSVSSNSQQPGTSTEVADTAGKKPHLVRLGCGSGTGSGSRTNSSLFFAGS